MGFDEFRGLCEDFVATRGWTYVVRGRWPRSRASPPCALLPTHHDGRCRGGGGVRISLSRALSLCLSLSLSV
jgi:hypothetical protein